MPVVEQSTRRERAAGSARCWDAQGGVEPLAVIRREDNDAALARVQPVESVQDTAKRHSRVGDAHTDRGAAGWRVARAQHLTVLSDRIL